MSGPNQEFLLTELGFGLCFSEREEELESNVG